MVEIEGITRKWGNSSLAFVIPKEIVERERLKANQKLRALILKQDNVLFKTFGILKDWKKPTDKIMGEIDRELWFEE
jgi:hypothetical protein